MTEYAKDQLLPDSPTASVAAPSPIGATATADPAVAAAAGATASNANATNAAATGYNAQTGLIDPNTMTSAGQMASMTGKDTPMMRRAAQEGILAAGRRGLPNSSIAAGNAMGAMADRATPLATHDATAYFNNMRANTDAMNRASEISTGRESEASLANAQFGTDVSKTNAQLATETALTNAKMLTQANEQNAARQTQASMFNAESQNKATMFDSEQATKISLFNADASNAIKAAGYKSAVDLNLQWLAGQDAKALANIESKYKTLISSNAAAGTMYSSYLTGLSMIMSTPDISPGRVEEYMVNMKPQMEGGLSFIAAVNGLDFGGGLPDVPEASTGGDTPTGGIYEAITGGSNQTTTPGDTTTTTPGDTTSTNPYDTFVPGPAPEPDAPPPAEFDAAGLPLTADGVLDFANMTPEQTQQWIASLGDMGGLDLGLGF